MRSPAVTVKSRAVRSPRSRVLDRCAQPDRRPGRRSPVAAVCAAHPGHDPPVVEAQPQLHAHRDGAVEALDDAYDVGRPVRRRHEVDDADRPVGGLDSRSRGRASRRGSGGGRACTDPSGAIRQRPLSSLAEEGGEAGGRVEARQAQPVDGSVAADERGGVQVSHERVILDPGRHQAYLLACSKLGAWPGALRSGKRARPTASAAGLASRSAPPAATPTTTAPASASRRKWLPVATMTSRTKAG